MVLGPRIAVGCYTHSTAVGIRIIDVDASGAGVERSSVSGIEHASFLVRHPVEPVLYAVSETDTYDDSGGSVVAVRFGPDWGTGEVLDRVSSRGAAPCHLSLDAPGEHLYVANYGSGSVAAHRLEPDGRFGELVAVHRHEGSGPTDRQQSPHAHCIVPAPGSDAVHAVDLGIDRVVRYRHRPDEAQPFVAIGEYVARPGSGPRHLAFHPHEPVAFVVGELDSTVSLVRVDPETGALEHMTTCSTLPSGWTGSSLAAEVAVAPSGRHVYVSNRGHDSLAILAYHAPDVLEPVGHVASGGAGPRHFAIDPHGDLLVVANQASDSLASFVVEPASGELELAAVTDGMAEPVCVRFLEAAP